MYNRKNCVVSKKAQIFVLVSLTLLFPVNQVLVLSFGVAVPVLALFRLMAIQAGSGELFEAVTALGWQFTHGFLHRQVPATQTLTDLTAAVRTRGLFFFETCVSEQVDKTACAHQVPICTLRNESTHLQFTAQRAMSKTISQALYDEQNVTMNVSLSEYCSECRTRDGSSPFNPSDVEQWFPERHDCNLHFKATSL